MRLPRAFLIAALALPLAGVIAQEQGPQARNRLITIEWSGGSQRSPNLRFGPILFSHPDPEGIVATVSNLTIFAQEAELEAPEGVLIAEAEGERTASFAGGARVTRGRLEATGPDLVYSEATGLGVLSGGADIVITPREEGQDPVLIDAATVEFDVDTDRSVSRGGVELVNGNQAASAEALEFAEDQDLGRLTGEERPEIRRTAEDGDELLIMADEIRVLTESKRLHAIGNVTVVDGSITSTGDEVFFDDESQLAEVVGNPAVSVDEANGVRLEADRIRQDIEFDFVEQILASEPSDFDPTVFLFEEERPDEAPAGQDPPEEAPGSEGAGG